MLSRSILFLLAWPCLANAQTFSYPWAVNGVQPGNFAESTSISKDASGNVFLGLTHSEALQFGAVSLGVVSGLDIGIVKFNASGIAQWGAVASGPGDDGILDIASDDIGNTYICGWFDDSLQLGSIKLVSTNPVFGDERREFFVACLNPDGNWLWARKQTGSAFSEARAIGIDEEGNCIIGGIFYNADLVIAQQTLPAQEILPFVVKYSASGDFIWARSANTPYAAELTSLDIGNDGTIYYTGFFGTAEDEVITINFGNIELINEGDPEEGFVSADMYVAAMNADGTYIWANSAGALYTEAYGLGIVCDENNNVYVCGSFYQSMNADNFSVATADGEFHQDIFIGMLDDSGEWMWINSYGNTQENIPGGLHISPDEHVYLYGEIGSFPLNLDGEFMISSAQDKSYIARINADGTIRWAFEHPQVTALVSDVQNRLFITGLFAGTVQLGNFSLSSTGGPGNPDIYVTQLDYTPLVPDGIAAEAGKLALTAYPNPGNGLYRINGLNDSFTYSVSDIRGQHISSGKIDSTAVIDLSDFSAGLYIVIITTANGELINLPVIKTTQSN